MSGVALDPLGLSNGYAVPGTINVRLKTWKVDSYTASPTSRAIRPRA